MGYVAGNRSHQVTCVDAQRDSTRVNTIMTTGNAWTTCSSTFVRSFSVSAVPWSIVAVPARRKKFRAQVVSLEEASSKLADP
jgi:hypothetical protein